MQLIGFHSFTKSMPQALIFATSFTGTKIRLHHFLVNAVILFIHLWLQFKVPTEAMQLITFVLFIVLTLFKGGWTVGFTPNGRQRAAALWSIKRANQSRALPLNLLQHLFPYIPIDDWSRLALVFNAASPRTQGLMRLVKGNKNKIIRDEICRYHDCAGI